MLLSTFHFRSKTANSPPAILYNLTEEQLISLFNYLNAPVKNQPALPLPENTSPKTNEYSNVPFKNFKELRY